MTGTQRISREQLYFDVCHALRKRSTCLRGKVGAIAVRDDRIIATAYNGSPPNAPHCFELGCDVDENNHESGCQRTIHAEANLIAFSAKHGIQLDESTLYCTHGPCLGCAKLIVASGFRSVVYETPYRLPDGLELLADLNVPARMIEPPQPPPIMAPIGKPRPAGGIHKFIPDPSGRREGCVKCGRTRDRHL